MPKITLFEGANRSFKTTTALKEQILAGKRILYVARTEKNIEETLKTIRTYIFGGQGLYNDRRYYIAVNLGKPKICPFYKKRADILDEKSYLVEKSIICNGCPRARGMSRPLRENLLNTKILDKPKLQTLVRGYEVLGCPKKMIMEYVEKFRNEKLIVLTTYQGAKQLTIGDFDVIIFDEAHHLSDIAKINSFELDGPTKKKWNKQVYKYLRMLNNLRIDLIGSRRHRIELKNDIEDFSRFLARELKREVIRRTWKTDYCVVRKPEFKSDSYTYAYLLREFNRSLDRDTAIHREYEILLRFVDFILTMQEEDVVFSLDITQNPKGYRKVEMILTRVDGDKEDREMIAQAMEQCEKIILITSTPFPKKYIGFWLGREYEIERRYFPTTFEYNLVVENIASRIRDIWESSINYERFGRKLMGVKAKLEEMGKTHKIFAKSGNESKDLKSKWSLESEYARGIFTEGVPIDADVLDLTGFPLQNIMSEEYRKNWIANMIGYDKPDEIIKEYRKIKAMQVLIQITFRNAKVGVKRGAIWRNVSKDIAEECQKMWSWLTHINILVMPKHLREEDKVRFMVKGVMEGKLPKSLVEERIERGVIEKLRQRGSMKKEILVKSVEGDDNLKRKIINEMIAEGHISQEIISGGVGRPKRLISL